MRHHGPDDTVVSAQIRRSLTTGAIAFVLLLVLVVLMLFTPLFAGTVGGIGIGYVIGFLDFVLVLVAAGLYVREQNRAETAGEIAP